MYFSKVKVSIITVWFLLQSRPEVVSSFSSISQGNEIGTYFSNQNVNKWGSGMHKVTKRKNDSSLYAIQGNGFKKNRLGKKDVPHLHADSFIENEEDLMPNHVNYELDLLRQKIQYDQIIKDASSNMLEEIEETVVQVQNQQESKRFSGVWYARLLLLLSAALNGTNFTFVKIMNENIPVQNGTILRFTLAAIATSPWLFQQTNDEEKSANNSDITKQNTDDNDEKSSLFLGDFIPSASNHAKILLAGLEVGCWTAFGYVSQAIGLETIQASTSAFICSLAVVIVPILDCLSGKKISSRTYFGAFMAVIGVAFLELDGLSIESIMSENGSFLSDGDIFTLLQPLTFGIGFWRMEHAMRRYPTEAMKLTAVQLTAVALVSILSCIGLSGISGLPSSADIIAWVSNPSILQSILWTGLINTALTIYLETVALKSVSAMETTIFLSTEPIFGSVFAGMVLGESFGQGGVLGAFIISVGCIFSNLRLNWNR